MLINIYILVSVVCNFERKFRHLLYYAIVVATMRTSVVLLAQITDFIEYLCSMRDSQILALCLEIKFLRHFVINEQSGTLLNRNS